MLEKLIAIANRHGRADGSASAHAGLVIRSVTAPTVPAPALFEPKFYLLLQGAKQMTIGGNTFNCNTGPHLRGGLRISPLPFVSAVVAASEAQALPERGAEARDAAVVAGLLLTCANRRLAGG